MKNQTIIDNFLTGVYPQIFCEKCAMTFLTNVYDFDANRVLLEKRSLGLEYYCGAIKAYQLIKVPEIHRVGILDEDDNLVKPPTRDEVYSGKETNYRFIYLMERLNHLDEADAEYFDRCVQDLEWRDDLDREKIYTGVSKRYNAELAVDIEKLYNYYDKYKDVIAWDLHGDNLMQRLRNDEIVILDPYTRHA